MAAPTVDIGSVTSISTAADPWTVNTGTPDNGELCLIFLRSATNAGFNSVSGWTYLLSSDSTDNSDDYTAILYRYCDGTEGANVSVDLTGSAKGCAIAYNIAGHDSGTPTLATVSTGTDATTEFNTASWGSARDARVFACAGLDGETQNVNSYPSGYTDGQRATNSGTGGAAATNNRLACAAIALTAATSETPGALTWSASPSNGWTGLVVAVLAPEGTFTPFDPFGMRGFFGG